MPFTFLLKVLKSWPGKANTSSRHYPADFLSILLPTSELRILICLSVSECPDANPRFLRARIRIAALVLDTDPPQKSVNWKKLVTIAEIKARTPQIILIWTLKQCYYCANTCTSPHTIRVKKQFCLEERSKGCLRSYMDPVIISRVVSGSGKS